MNILQLRFTMVIKFIKQRWKRITLTITASIILFLAVLVLLINFYWSPVLGEKLKATILKTTDSLYSVNFSKSSLSFIKGELTIDNIELRPNMAVYNRKKQAHLAPNSLYSLKIQRLVIHHLHPLNLYFNKRIDVDQITISTPDLHVSYEQNREQDTIIKDKKTPFQLISKVLNSVHINRILLNDVKFSYSDNTPKKANKIELNNLNFIATDFLIDSTTQQSTSRFLFCKDFSLELNDYSGTVANKRYAYKIGSLKFSTLTSKLIASKLSFGPVKSVNEFFKGNNDDCFAFSLDSLLLNHFDYKAYSKYHSILASSLRLSNGKFEMYSNPAPNDSSIDQSLNFPQVLLHKLKLNVKVDTLLAKALNVYYTEYSFKSGQNGTVNFNNINGSIFNITNNKDALLKNNIAHADFTANLMNAAKMTTSFAFNLTDDSAPFSYRGSVGTVDLQKVNPIAVPLGMLKISSGMVKQLDFDMQANKDMATGKVTGLYNNLKIVLLKKNEENTLKRMSIVSFLANAMIIKHDNPMPNQPIRVVKVVWQRRLYSPFFSFMWKSLLAGIKESVGYDAKTERTVKEKISEFKQNKLTRSARKAERIQRREARQQKRALRKQQQELIKAQTTTPPD